ncbi:hypothetical protein H4S04_006246 [Coemansia sp. S16]|nr:hypothetical protein H4S03_006313 [Coemansia sp. S3946]KAJ2044383.1 hypothetical protein H4S04_006246 [Coemansia sp. S16]KAJ2352331.1 hypothetical protein GGH92_001317 [Coemansia sp. RSA 2673]
MFVASTPGAHGPMSEHNTSSRGIDHHHQQPPQSRSFGLGIRRAKTATGNSIKRLFKHSSKPDSSVAGEVPRKGITAEPIDSPSPPSSTALLHSEAIHRPFVEHCRPPSARSTKSVRSIFSSAKRITLRPSTLFRKHTPDMLESPHVAPASNVGSSFGSPRISPAIHARPASPVPTTTDIGNRPQQHRSPMPPPPPPPMGQWMRHASNIKAERARNNPIDYGGEHLSTAEDDWHSTAPSVQKLRRCPPMPIHHIPLAYQPVTSPEHSTTYSAPTTVSASVSISASIEVSAPPSAAPSATTKSPMSFSSKSLGLSLLDFGYNERAVHDFLPPSSSPESAASGPPSPSPPGSLLSSAEDLVAISPPLQVACEQKYLSSDDCQSLDGGYCSSDSLHSRVLSSLDPASPVETWSTIVRTLGAPEPVCAAAIPTVILIAALNEDADCSPFVIRGIDDLLLELGVDGTAFIADIDIPEELLLLPPAMTSADADVLSLREIDRLIEQLGHPHAACCIGCADYCERPTRKSRMLDVPALLDTAAFVGVMTNIADTTNIEPLAESAFTSPLEDTCRETPECHEVDASAIITELGHASALATLLPLAPVLNVDFIIQQLGDVSAATYNVPLPQAKACVPVLNVAELVLELSKATTPEFACQLSEDNIPLAPSLDIAEVVEMLGNPAGAVRIALTRATAAVRPSLAKGLMRTPEPGTAVGLEGLGGVYTSEWLVHDMEHAGMVGEQILDASTTFNLFKFPQLSIQSNTQGLESRMSAELSGSGMDVDEVIIDSRSRSSSMSLDHHDGAQYINRLITALRIQPIVVSRPFLGPRRNMLFPHLC